MNHNFYSETGDYLEALFYLTIDDVTSYSLESLFSGAVGKSTLIFAPNGSEDYEKREYGKVVSRSDYSDLLRDVFCELHYAQDTHSLGAIRICCPHVKRVIHQPMYVAGLAGQKILPPEIDWEDTSKFTYVDMVEWFYKYTVLSYQERLSFDSAAVFKMTGLTIPQLWKRVIKEEGGL